MKYDVFISYRREGGYDTAKHLNDLLVRDGYNVSFDIDTLRNGDFDTQLLDRIEQCKDFILIVDKHAFDRTLNPTFDPKKDWLRCELAHALKHNKNIIPVFLSGVSSFPENLPEDVAGVVKKNGPEYNKYYFNEFYKQLRSRFLKSKSIKTKIIWGLLLSLVIAMILLPFVIKDNTNDIVYKDPMVPYSTNETEFNDYALKRLNRIIDSIGIPETESMSYFMSKINDADSFVGNTDSIAEKAHREIVESEVNLGLCYMFGFGGSSKNINKGIKYISKAADSGNAVAQYLIGVCYDNGIGVEVDIELAIDWYRKAAEQGVVEAQYDYGIACTVKNNMAEAFNCLNKAAERGYAKAQYAMGWNYGGNNNISQATYWLEKAAEQGYALAQIALANSYRQGPTHLRDYDTAVEIYSDLAKENDAIALYGLGLCYAQGLGVDTDIELAMEYLKKSAELGYAMAITDLANVYVSGIQGVPQNLSKAMDLYREAAEQGFPMAQFYIGRMYENGWGVDKDIKEANKWYEKAERQNFSKQLIQNMQQQQLQNNNN